MSDAPVFPAVPAPQGLDLRALLALLRRRLWLVLGLPLAAGLMGAAAMATLTPRYTSQLQLLIEPRPAGAIGPEGAFGQVAVDHTKVASVFSVLESTLLLRRVVRAEGLADDPGFIPQEGDVALREARAVSRLRDAVKVVRIGVTYVLRLDATAATPERARRLAAALADAYLAEQLEAKVEAARRASAWSATRLAELREELLRSEREVERIRRAHNIIEGDRGSVLGRQAISEGNAALLQAEAELRDRQARLDQALRAARGGAEALPEAVASGTVGGLRAQQAEVSRRVAELRQRFGPQHPELLRAEEERRAIERQIGAEVGRIVQNLRNEQEVALRRRDAAREQLSRSTVDAVDPRGLVLLREAERVAQANRQLYDGALAQAREAEAQTGRQEPEARVISPASLPEAPSFPNPLFVLVLPVAVAAGLGSGLAVLLGALERRFATPGELAAATGLPVLATVPRLGRRERTGVVDYAADRRLSRFAEALRELRLGLRGPGVVLVTSAVPAEGKSTLAAALAVSAAQAGLRVALVDGDFRHPSVSRLFGVEGARGFAEALQGAGAEGVRFGETRLTLLPAGSSVPDLAAPVRLREALEGLAASHDLVLVDGPPVLAVADARALAAAADAVLMVVEWRRTPREAVAHALGALRQAGARLPALVLNKADLRRVAEYGGYGRAHRATERYYRD